MNRSLAAVVVFFFGFFLVSPASEAEPPKIDHVIELLHQAKDSSSPLGLLEKARNVLKDFDPSPNANKERAAGMHGRKIAANSVGAGEHKKKAMEAINDAIQVAKAGGDVKPKIDHAVAMAHEAGDLKR